MCAELILADLDGNCVLVMIKNRLLSTFFPLNVLVLNPNGSSYDQRSRLAVDFSEKTKQWLCML